MTVALGSQERKEIFRLWLLTHLRFQVPLIFRRKVHRFCPKDQDSPSRLPNYPKIRNNISIERGCNEKYSAVDEDDTIDSVEPKTNYERLQKNSSACETP